MPTYYLDGPSLAQATAVYTDSALMTCAADGVYSDGTITRVQTGCVLGSAKFCPSCGEGCGTSLDELKVTTGVYLIALFTDKDTQVIASTWANIVGILLTNAFSIVGTIMGVKYASEK